MVRRQVVNNAQLKSFKIDSGGFLIAPVVLIQEDVLDYSDTSMDIAQQYIPAEEIAKLEGTDGVPISYKHPEGGYVNTDNAPFEVMGFAYDFSFDDGKLTGTVKITDKNLIEKVKSKEIREVSLGYDTELEKQNGVFKGKKYGGIQRQIKLNHLAVVDEGRGGADVRLVINGRNKMDINELKDIVRGEFKTILNEKNAEARRVEAEEDRIAEIVERCVNNALGSRLNNRGRNNRIGGALRTIGRELVAPVGTARRRNSLRRNVWKDEYDAPGFDPYSLPDDEFDEYLEAEIEREHQLVDAVESNPNPDNFRDLVKHNRTKAKQVLLYLVSDGSFTQRAMIPGNSNFDQAYPIIRRNLQSQGLDPEEVYRLVGWQWPGDNYVPNNSRRGNMRGNSRRRNSLRSNMRGYGRNSRRGNSRRNSYDIFNEDGNYIPFINRDLSLYSADELYDYAKETDEVDFKILKALKEKDDLMAYRKLSEITIGDSSYGDTLYSGDSDTDEYHDVYAKVKRGLGGDSARWFNMLGIEQPTMSMGDMRGDIRNSLRRNMGDEKEDLMPADDEAIDDEVVENRAQYKNSQRINEDDEEVDEADDAEKEDEEVENECSPRKNMGGKKRNNSLVLTRELSTQQINNAIERRNELILNANVICPDRKFDGKRDDQIITECLVANGIGIRGLGHKSKLKFFNALVDRAQDESVQPINNAVNPQSDVMSLYQDAADGLYKEAE